MSGPRDLVALVHSYRWLDADPSRDIAVASLDHGEPAWRRSIFDPGHFTASGLVASPDRSSILLIHHPRHDRGLQPGGHIEPGDESVEAAARREVAEETGVTGLVRIGAGILRIDAHDIPARSDEPPHIHIDLALGFLAESSAIGPVSEVIDAAWVPFDDLEGIDTDDALRSGARSLRRALAGHP